MLALATLLRCAGAHVDIERACPDLYRRRDRDQGGDYQEAILDIVAKFPGSLHQLCINVTVRSPFAGVLLSGVLLSWRCRQR